MSDLLQFEKIKHNAESVIKYTESHLMGIFLVFLISNERLRTLKMTHNLLNTLKDFLF